MSVMHWSVGQWPIHSIDSDWISLSTVQCSRARRHVSLHGTLTSTLSCMPSHAGPDINFDYC